MVLFYFGMTAVLLLAHLDRIPGMFALIFSDAFTGDAVSGGVIGAVMR